MQTRFSKMTELLLLDYPREVVDFPVKATTQN